MKSEKEITRIEDETALKIYFILLEKYHELSSNVGEYANIIGVFFHEIMIFTTSFYLNKNSEGYDSTEIDFPYLSFEYVNKPYILDDFYFANKTSKSKGEFSRQIKTKIINLIYEFIFNGKIWLLNNLYRGKKDICLVGLDRKTIDEIFKLKKDLNIRIDHDQVKCYLKEIDYQLMYLEKVLIYIFGIIENENYNHKILAASFINYTKNKITNKKIFENADYLFCGSLTFLPHRIQAANFKNNEKIVISMCHGGANPISDFDEPMFGYGELSYCDHYIDYGKKKDLNEYKYLRPINNKMPQMHYMNSNLLFSIHKTPKIKHVQLNADTKILYIPNSLSGSKRYGPFRDMSDFEYLKWQESILETGYNISVKVHPQDVNNNLYKNQKIVNSNLQLAVENYDILLIDYFGTAYAIAAATDKPILHFNLGLRHMSKAVMTNYKKRVHWFEINLEDNFSDQIETAFSQYNKETTIKINNYTNNASLNDNPEANIYGIISNIIKASD